ncbi:MAG: phage tail protein [Saprospiraceae bacterium]|nr:phage tail protein [Saprospiraceae bacterium]
MSEFRWQHVSFHFEVSFNGIGQKALDAKFQSVAGLEVQLETESIKEGGENRFEHTIPLRRKYSNLTLKRGALGAVDGSLLYDWCKRAFQLEQIRTVNLDVILLNQDHKALMKWKVINAWPKSWKMGELNAEKGEILIETLELVYNRFEFS